MRTIKWLVESYFCGCHTTGEFEVEDNATQEEIEKIIKDGVLNEIGWSWWEGDKDELS